MKKFIALAVLASSTVSFAASSDIYDIQYLPSPGTTYGFTTAEMVDATYESDFFGASEEDEISGTIITQTIGHAFTDRFSLQGSINHASLEYDPEEGSKFDYRDGISDPLISARFRTMDENARWDLIGGAVISLGDEEVKSNNDRNNYQGGHSLFIGTQYGIKSENMQWAILGQLVHNMEATTDDKRDGVDSDYDNDSNNELLVQGDILNKLAEKSFLRSHLSVNFAEEIENDSDDVIATTAPATTWEIGTEYQHLFSQDLLARVGVDYSTVNQDTGHVDTFDIWTFRIGANYQF